MPLVSVVTPAFNAARTLGRAHESVRRQRAEWQHIIVNDGSTDATGQLISELSTDPRVTGVTRPNGGSGAALNTGLQFARGEFIAFLDADDEYLPNHLEAHLAFLGRRPEVDLVWGGVEIVAATEEDEYVPDVVRGFGRIHVSECTVQGTIFGRAKVFETLRYTEDRAIWYQDYDLVQRARAQFHVERFPERTYRYYMGQGGSIIDSIKKNWPDARD